MCVSQDQFRCVDLVRPGGCVLLIRRDAAPLYVLNEKILRLLIETVSQEIPQVTREKAGLSSKFAIRVRVRKFSTT